MLSRYNVDGTTYVHVTDGGYTDMGETIVAHLDQYYTDQDYIDNVILTHPDGDHARGLKYVLENKLVSRLYMNRPWIYADELLPRFKGYSNVDNLRKELRDAYPNVAALEDIALEKEIPISEALQGTPIGCFTVMAPSKSRLLDLIVDSEKTPKPSKMSDKSLARMIESAMIDVLKAAANFVKSAWGEETFSTSGTSCENEMSVVQYAKFKDLTFLLTGDAGKDALVEVIEFAPSIGLSLPGIDRFQVPHHGSRRNVSTDILNSLLGDKLDEPITGGNEKFTAIISSAAGDPDHPRKSVERAMHHRGGFVVATEGNTVSTGYNAPARPGWVSLSSRPYPDEQEE